MRIVTVPPLLIVPTVPIIFLAALLARAPAPAAADEGQWTPDQLSELDRAKLASMGLELSTETLWNPAGDERTGGLMRAVVNYGGCSASFISPEGLMATNHHCAYGAIQSNSTPENDYLTDGFLARTRAQELETKGRTVKVLVRVQDVTDKIRPPADAAPSDRARQALIDRTSKELVAACESAADDDKPVRCQVESFYNGSQYRLFAYLELLDVRLVYAPPDSIGEYGGEVDNWMWPRHTGDFSLLRAYVGPDGKPAPYAPDNVPYQPGQFLRVSADDVSPGDFVAIMGYPVRTTRYLSAAEIARQIDQALPFKVDFYGEWIAILEAHGKRDEAVRIKVAALLKRLANRHKNARGMLDGLAHMKLHEKRLADEEALRAWAADKKKYQGVLEELSALANKQRTRHVRSRILRDVQLAPHALAIGIHVVRKSRAAPLADLDRPESYQEREWDKLWRRIERHMRDHDAGVDAALLAALLARNAALPEAERLPPLTRLARRAKGASKTKTTREEFLPLATELIAGSKLADRAYTEALWQRADPKAIAQSDDPVLALAREFADLMEAEDALELEHDGALARLRPRYFEMLEQVRTGPVYPDANGTLRFSYASIQGYDTWDGRTHKPQTILAGAIKKYTGQAPFDLPERVRKRAGNAAKTHWADDDLGDLGLCFLSNGDTTGGNSGSPVIDGKGRLVGLNFDRVWENIAGDFSYFQGHSRNINVDIRYLLWMLDQVDDAGHLLQELGVAELRGERPPETNATSAGADDKTDEGSSEKSSAKKSGCGCDTRAHHDQLGALIPWFVALVGLTLATRRRRRSGARGDA